MLYFIFLISFILTQYRCLISIWKAEDVMKQLVDFVTAVELRSSAKDMSPMEVVDSLKMTM